MKKILVLLISLSFFSLPYKVYASHAAGAELTYVWLSDSTYRFYAKFYRDCSGISEPSSVALCINNACTGFSTSISLSKMTSIPGGGTNGSAVSTGCPGNPTSCNGGSVTGFREWWYTGTYTLPTRCSNWKFSFQECCRNSAITNLSNPSNFEIYVEATLNNTTVQNNTSPSFTNKPTPYVCAGQPFAYNNGTVEPNGDSLVFESIPPRYITNSNCPYTVGNIAYSSILYNAITNPFNTGNTFTCDPATGTVSFTAIGQQVPMLTIRCLEYRNGVLIGTVMRDVQMVIANCVSPVPTQALLTNTITNATFDTVTTFVTQGCYTASPITFCYSILSANVNAVLVPSDNHLVALPGSSVTYTGLGTDSVIGCVTWTPSLADTGLSLLVVNVKDSTCTVGSPFIVTNSITIPIFIGNFVNFDSINITNVINCTVPNTGGILSSATSNASNLLYTVSPGNITNNSGIFTGLPIGVYTLSVSDGSICTLTSIVNIQSPNTPQFTSTVITNATCGLNNGGISASAFAPNGGSVSYVLLPSGTNNLTGIFTGLTGGTYTIVASDGFLCTNSTVQTIVAIAPPAISAALNASACGGSAANIVVAQLAGNSTPFTYNINGGLYQTSDTFFGINNGTYTLAVKDSNNCTTSIIQNVVLPAALNFSSLIPADPWCVPDNNGSISVMATGGTGLLLYSNSGGVYQAGGTFNNLMAGIYTIWVKDGSNCTATSTVSLSIPASPTITSLVKTNANCGAAVGSVTISANGGQLPYSYALYNPLQLNGSGIFSGLTANNYNVTVTDGKGCNFTSAVQITGTPKPIINSILKTPVTCGNTNGSITVGVTNGTAPYTYSNGGGFNTANNFTGLGNSSYIIVVADALGCTGTSMVALAFAPSPSISASAPPIVCANGNSTLTVNIQSGNSTPFSYSVNGSAYQTSNTFLVGAGAYTVTVKDSNNCTTTTLLALANPSNLVLNNTSTTAASCNPGNDAIASISASGGTGSLQYAVNGGTAQTNNSFINLGVGTYTATVTDAVGCTATTVFTINLSPAVSILLGAVSPNYCLKNNGTANVTASGGTGTYSYSANGTNYGNNGGNFTGLGTAAYTLMVTDAKGCTASNTAAIIAIAGPIINALVVTPNTCGLLNGTITATASSPATITNYSIISQNNLGGTFSNLAGAIYTLTVTDNHACSATITAAVVNAPSPVISMAAVPITCHNGSTTIAVTVSNGNSTPLSFSLNGGTTQASTNFTNVNSGLYTVNVVDSNGCNGVATLSIANPALLQVSNVLHTAPSCDPNFDGSVSLFASGGTGTLQYQMNGGMAQAAPTFTGLTQGTYTFACTDANGCMVSTVHTVLPSPAVTLTYNTSTPDFCDKNNGYIGVTAALGSAPYNYLLNGVNFGNNGGSFTGITSGNYTITVADIKGCTATAPAVVAAVAGPTITSVLVTNNTCNLNNGTVSVAATTPGLLTNFNMLSNNNLSGFFGGLVGGTYTVTVADNNNCTLSATAILQDAPSPQISVNASPIACHNGSTTINVNLISGNSTPISFALDGGTAQLSQQFANITQGTHTIVAADSNNCTATATIVLSNPSPVIITGTNHVQPTCDPGNDGILTVNATGGSGAIQYQINNGGYVANNTFTGLAANSYNIIVQDANSCTAATSLSINNPVAPTFNPMQTTQETCIPGSDGTAWALASGGTGVVNFSTNGGLNWQANNQFVGLSAATYTMTARDAKFCTSTITFTINNFPQVNLTVDSAVDVSCYANSNGKIVVSGSGGTGNKVYTNANTNVSNSTGIFLSLAAATYTINVTDSAGCSAQQIVTITEPNQLVIDSAIATHIACNGNPNGSITLYTSGGTGTKLYTLLPTNINQLSATFAQLVAGTYIILVSDTRGCTASTILSVTQPVTQTFTPVTTSAASCYNTATGSLSTFAIGGTAPYTFSINLASNNSGIFTNLATGIYTILCLDAQNCAATTVAFIQQPTPVNFVSASASSAVCNGSNTGSISSISAGGTGLKTYTAVPGNASSTTGNFSAMAAGTYVITSTDINGCSSNTTVTIVQPPAIRINSFSYISPICPALPTGSILLSAAGGTAPYTYNINNSAYTSFASYTNLMPGIYTIGIRDDNGCTKDTVISLQPLNNFFITEAAVVNPTCEADATGSIAAAVSGTQATGYYFEIQPLGIGNYTGTFAGLGAGVYTLAVRDAIGCEVSTVVVIAQPLNNVLAQISATQIICSFGLTAGSAAVSANGGAPPYAYQWSRAIADTVAQINNLLSGFYSVLVTDLNGCTDTDTVTIFEAPCCDVAFANSFTPDGDGLNDKFKPLTSATTLNITFSIFDRWGNQVFATTNSLEQWNGKYQGNDCEMGTYYYVYKYFCNYSEKWIVKSGDITLIR